MVNVDIIMDNFEIEGELEQPLKLEKLTNVKLEGKLVLENVGDDDEGTKLSIKNGNWSFVDKGKKFRSEKEIRDRIEELEKKRKNVDNPNVADGIDSAISELKWVLMDG